VKPGTARRVLLFAVPHLRVLALFLAVVTADAMIGVVNPLIYRRIINDGILKSNAPPLSSISPASSGCWGSSMAVLGSASDWHFLCSHRKNPSAGHLAAARGVAGTDGGFQVEMCP